MTTGDSKSSQYDEHLEVRAYFAIGGMSEDWKGDLAKFLRSGLEISQDFRDHLADIVEGNLKDRPRLELVNRKRQYDRKKGSNRRKNWQTVGEWIDQQIAGGMTRSAAIELASKNHKPAMSEKSCDAALDYSRRASSWRDSLEEDHPFVRVLGRDRVIDLFHNMDAQGKPLDKGEQDDHLAHFD